jgi:thymidylate synthase
MEQYLNLLKDVKTNGIRKKSRPVLQSTGQSPDTFAVFGRFFQHDLSKGFPLLTTKKLSFKFIRDELLWMISGSSNNKDLEAKGVDIWKEWADPVTGELGPVYGVQWRSFIGVNRDTSEKVIVDQLSNCIKTLRTKPSDRRMIVSAWNPAEIPQMKLPPCHLLFQFGVLEDRLNLTMFQRSADIFLGVPYNIASYALLTHMVAHITGFKPGTLSITFGDLHAYENHMTQIEEQLSRAPKALPSLLFSSTDSVKEIDDYQSNHLVILNYDAWPSIKAEVAV